MLFVILGILKTKLSLNKACLYYQAFWHPVHTIAEEDLTVYGFKKILPKTWKNLRAGEK